MRRAPLATLVILVFIGRSSAWARGGGGSADDDRRTRLAGNVHPQARPEHDRGAVADEMRLGRMLLLLQRSADQERELKALLADQQDPTSARYHAWVTPAEFGRRFGPADADVARVTEWLGRRGFAVAEVAAGRSVIEFSGSAGQVRDGFHTEVHRFGVNGSEHLANVADPEIPTAFAPVVAGVVSLNDFHKRAHLHALGPVRRDPASGIATPLFNILKGKGFYAVGPGDFARIYGVPSNLDGTGVTIAIVGETNINLADVRAFRSLFALPANDPHIIVNGVDPGIISDESEANLDVQWSGAVAPAATIDLVVSQSTETTQGIDLSALYIVDHNLASVMSESYGACEGEIGAAGIAFYRTLWEQAAAQGITVVVSTGDTGAGCTFIAGLGVNGVGSSPNAVAVGGTDFDDLASLATYWATSNASPSQTSALSYIPEQSWNDSSCVANYPAACTSPDTNADYAAGGGGASTAYSKPSWQTALTPADGHRDLPDISLFAGNGANRSFYVICQSDRNTDGAPCDLQSPYQHFLGVGGTSASAPAFAAIVALLNQSTGRRLGNVNPVLYGLAGQVSHIFHDVTKGSISIACKAGTSSCSNTSSTGFGVLLESSGTPAGPAKAGYDLATGLGSLDVTNLVGGWPAAGAATATTIAVTSNMPVAIGQPIAFTASVTGQATPTGAIMLVATVAGGRTESLGPFQLAGGTVSSTTNLIPGGTSQLAAHYSGDSTFAPSTSSPVTVTVTPTGSQVRAGLVINNFMTGAVTSLSAQTAAYGSPYVLRMSIADASGRLCAPSSTDGPDPVVPSFPCASGTVTLMADGNPLDDGTFPLNGRGYTEDVPIQLDAGAHSVIASYDGDTSYGASSATVPIQITQASTTATVTSTTATVDPGDHLQLNATVQSTSNGAAPTGTVHFLIGTKDLDAVVVYTRTSGASCQSSDTTKCASISALGTIRSDEIAQLTAVPGDRLSGRGITALAGLALVLSTAWLFARNPTGGRRWLARGTVSLSLLVSAMGMSCGGSDRPSQVTVTVRFDSDPNYATATSAPVTVKIKYSAG